MQCLDISQLPSPPLDKTGWPWIDQGLVKETFSGSEWPKITVVTPSYNQGQFIEETIRSVLLQKYPNLEYIIIDGGSTDQTIEIIRKYERYLFYWISESDNGQSHALNKSLSKVTGEIFTFLNSDDLLAPNALIKIANYFANNSNRWIVCGGVQEIDENSKVISKYDQLPVVTWQELVLGKTYQPQAGTFWRSQAFSMIGQFREDLHYCFDQEFFIRFLMKYELETIPGILACPRIHGTAKSQSNSLGIFKEKHDITLRFLPFIQGKFWSKLLAYRSIKLSYIGRNIVGEKKGFIDKMLVVLQEPILLTSPLFIKKIFLKGFESN